MLQLSQTLSLGDEANGIVRVYLSLLSSLLSSAFLKPLLPSFSTAGE